MTSTIVSDKKREEPAKETAPQQDLAPVVAKEQTLSKPIEIPAGNASNEKIASPEKIPSKKGKGASAKPKDSK